MAVRVELARLAQLQPAHAESFGDDPEIENALGAPIGAPSCSACTDLHN